VQPLYSSLWCCYSSLVVMAVLSIPDQSDAVWLRVDDLDGLVNFLGVCLPRAAVIPDSRDRKRKAAHVLSMFLFTCVEQCVELWSTANERRKRYQQSSEHISKEKCGRRRVT
jgi:hypothetical protein